MRDEQPAGVSTPPTRARAALRELIEALDRRIPHLERASEAGIARDAATLRSEALTRIDALEPHLHDQALADAVMTDDGGPSRENGTGARPGVAGREPPPYGDP